MVDSDHWLVGVNPLLFHVHLLRDAKPLRNG